MQKIMNEAKDIVKESLKGLEYANPEIKVFLEEQVVVKKDINQNKVSLISGGGSGHEPAHAGFVGKGMLDGAIAGEVFTSPTPNMIQKALDETKSSKGALLIVKNYTGDVMNFEIAKDLANFDVEHVIVNDDVAVENSLYTAGRRGIAGTIFVHKIAGACAEEGHDLKEVKKVAQKVIDNVRSMGVSLGGCTIPKDGKKSFELKDDEMEIGIGIHGEPGTHKGKVQVSKEIVKTLLDKILKDKDFSNSKVALMINGLGGTSLLDLFVANKDANEFLKEKGIKVAFNKVGNFMTSLEMPGMSISVLKLDEQLEKYLNKKTDAPGW